MIKFNKFILICESFPPSALGHSQRIAKLCKYLPKVSNWIPTVLCGIYQKDTGYDKDLLDEIPKEIEVYRIKGFESNVFYNKIKETFLGKIIFQSRKLYTFPDHRVDWARNVFKFAIKKFGKGDKFKLIFASGPPRSSYMAGFWLSRYWNKPLIIDMRDPWEPYYLSRKYTPFHAIINEYIEKKIYSHSKLIIANTDGNKKMILNKYPQFKNKVVVIPNGYDPDDMNPDIGPSLKTNLETIDFLYLGGIRGKIPNGDIFEGPFLRIIRELLEVEPELRKKLRVHFIGLGNTLIVNYVNKLKLNDICIFHGPVSSREIGKPLKEADACVVILNPEAENSGWIPAKTYYYLASGKPILAISPECELTKLIKKYAKSYEIIYPNDIEAIPKIKNFIKIILENKNDNVTNTVSIDLYRFSRENIAKKISKILNNIILK